MLTRTIPKLFFGIQGFIECDEELSHFNDVWAFAWGRYNDKGKCILERSWWTWNKMDDINRRLATLSNVMVRGMTLDICTAYFYYVKPLHVIGHIAKRDDIRSYWRRLMPPNRRVVRD